MLNINTTCSRSLDPVMSSASAPSAAKRHDLEEALLSLEVVLQGGLGVVDRRVPQGICLS